MLPHGYNTRKTDWQVVASPLCVIKETGKDRCGHKPVASVEVKTGAARNHEGGEVAEYFDMHAVGTSDTIGGAGYTCFN